LVEGRLLLTPTPAPDHNHAELEMAVQLYDRLPPGLEVIPDMDVDLELAPAEAPCTVRRTI
jgi:hypothetical protein